MKQTNNFTRRTTAMLAVLMMILMGGAAVFAQTTAFTYQGRFTDTNVAQPTNGTYDFQFVLYDANGAAVASNTTATTGVSVVNGIFTARLDFGAAAFNTAGADRLLEIRVKKPAETNYAPLAPRQPITSTPYSIQSLNAATATTAQTAATATTAGNVTGVVAVANGGTGSQTQNFVDLTTAQTINGDKTFSNTVSGSVLNAATQFNLGGNRILSATEPNNLFVGTNAGFSNPTGNDNAFFGKNAGYSNTTGSFNSFFGSGAGYLTTTGLFNSFFGGAAGGGNTSGSNNSFVGVGAGEANSTGGTNSFFGRGTGANNLTGSLNSFYGGGAGFGNTTGGGNSFFGVSTGAATTTGGSNAFFGTSTGRTNTTGGNNTLLGNNADVASNNLEFASAVGARAVVASNDTIVIGKAAGTYDSVARPADTVRIPGNLNVTGSFTGSFTVPAANVTGTFNASQIPDLDAAKITSGTFAASQIPNLDAGKITSGIVADARLSATVALRNAANTFAGNQTINGNLTQTGTTTDLNLTNGFLSRGTFGTGAIPATGAGTRMMFYSRKAAFRAGRASSTEWDDASIGDASAAMGSFTTASGISSAAFGNNTTASGNYSTSLGVATTTSGEGSLAAGFGSVASGSYSFALGNGAGAISGNSVALNFSTTASGNSSIAMGRFTTASGDGSTAAGIRTTASGEYSTALGGYASTNDKTGSFVYGDRSTTTDINATVDNQFVVRAQKIWLGTSNNVTNVANRFIETSTGAYLSTSGVWTNNSSVNLKTNFTAVDSRDVLRKVLGLQIQTWNYKVDAPDIRHIGVMAQDFYKAFQVGADDEHITPVDTAGVTMAAIQGLNAELDERTTKLQTENDALRSRIENQQKQIDALVKLICAGNPSADVCRQP